MKGQKQINPQITQITQILMITLYERETRFLATGVGGVELIKVPT
jgi:hypothetical protein